MVKTKQPSKMRRIIKNTLGTLAITGAFGSIFWMAGYAGNQMYRRDLVKQLRPYIEMQDGVTNISERDLNDLSERLERIEPSLDWYEQVRTYDLQRKITPFNPDGSPSHGTNNTDNLEFTLEPLSRGQLQELLISYRKE